MIGPEIIGELLLQLYAVVEEVEFPEFHETALTLIKSKLDFNAGIFGMGAMVDGEPRPHYYHLHGKEPPFMASWNAVKHEDVLIPLALSQVGHPVRTSISDALWESSPAARKHCHEHGIAHVLCTFLHDKHTDLFHVLSLYRRPDQRPFSDKEARLKGMLAPHLVQAANASRLRHIKSILVTKGQGGTAAVMDREGVIHQAEMGFRRLLELEWPDRIGSRLPEAMIQAVGVGKRHAGQRIVIDAVPVEDLYLLSARRLTAFDRLSRRELEIAQYYGQGNSHKEIAQTLCISPATVRNHLAAIYAKLGIQNKTQLVIKLKKLSPNGAPPLQRPPESKRRRGFSKGAHDK